jgi:hypothetical protein
MGFLEIGSILKLQNQAKRFGGMSIEETPGIRQK